MYQRYAYLSKIRDALEPSDLDALVSTSRLKNELLSVTALLYCGQEHYFQYLEGPPASIDRLSGALRADKRHEIMEEFHLGPAKRRFFEGSHLWYFDASDDAARFISTVIFLSKVGSETGFAAADFRKLTVVETCEVISELDRKSPTVLPQRMPVEHQSKSA